MKRIALVSTLCVLFFTKMLAASTFEAINQLSEKCALGDKKACERLMKGIEKLTDQALLAKIAAEDEYPVARKVAAGKLTDQAALARIAVEDKDSLVRFAAV